MAMIFLSAQLILTCLGPDGGLRCRGPQPDPKLTKLPSIERSRARANRRRQQHTSPEALPRKRRRRKVPRLLDQTTDDDDDDEDNDDFDVHDKPTPKRTRARRSAPVKYNSTGLFVREKVSERTVPAKYKCKEPCQQLDIVLEGPTFQCYAAQGDPVCRPSNRLRLLNPPGGVVDTNYNEMVTQLEENRYKLKSPHNLFRERCAFEEPFAPLKTEYDPSYWVCARLHIARDEPWPRTWYFPWDSEDAQVDCNALPFLMDIAVGGDKDAVGIAADVGASHGNCAFLLLSHGHRVHMFDFALTPNIEHNFERDMVNMTLTVNNWTDRAFMHGGLNQKLTLDSVLSQYDTVHIIKIDVDGIDAITAVVRGVKSMASRTKCFYVEMPAAEVTPAQKMKIGRFFHSLGFEWYGVRDKIELTLDDPDFWSGRAFISATMDSGMAPSEMAAYYNLDYVRYGQLSANKFQLHPVCACSEGGADPTLQVRVVILGQQYAFVRRDSDMFQSIKRRFSSCPPCTLNTTVDLSAASAED